MPTLDDRKIQGQSITWARQLLDSLNIEYQALVENDISLLASTLERKNEAISKLQQLEKILGEQGCLDLHDAVHDTPAGGRWHEFSQLMGQCRHQNDVNGRIIHMRQHSTNTALSLLRGQEHMQQTGYDADGKSISSPVPKRIATV